jgi:hypothetical protein
MLKGFIMREVTSREAARRFLPKKYLRPAQAAGDSDGIRGMRPTYCSPA